MLITLPTLLDSKSQLVTLLEKTLNAETADDVLIGQRALYMWIDKLHQQLYSDHATFSTLLREKGELEKKLRQANDWSEEKSKYTLYTLPAGNVVYRPTHNVFSHFYLCANCFTKRAKSILQPFQKMLECHKCNTTIPAS